MVGTSNLSRLDTFARSYIRGISHHSEVRTERLIEDFRDHFRLPAFPSLTDLQRLCNQLDIPLKTLPRSVPLDGANIWASDSGPEIYVRDDLQVMRMETTICHEIREVLETAFKRENPAYQGLDTADNAVMNRESDFFASCLLILSA